MKLNLIETLGVHFVNAYTKAFPKGPETFVVRVDEGRTRAAAVAKYMGEQAATLRKAFDTNLEAYSETGSDFYRHEAAMYQSGAAGAELASNLLLSLLAGDKDEFKAHFNAFVNDAVDGGVVTV